MFCFDVPTNTEHGPPLNRILMCLPEFPYYSWRPEPTIPSQEEQGHRDNLTQALGLGA